MQIIFPLMEGRCQEEKDRSPELSGECDRVPITQTVGAAPITGMYRGRRHSPQNWKQRQESRRQRHQASRVVRDEQIRRLHDDGATVTEIARHLKISRPTVYAHLSRGTPPELKTRTVRPSERV